jgi:hypothetical protein
MEQIFTELPIWGVFVGTLLLVVMSVEAGYRWARQRQQKREREKEAPVGAMVGATLGLLAFLLAFTFGIAADAFHARKVALVQEANAIRVTYLLANTIPEAYRSEIRTILREYTDERLRWANGQPNRPGASANDLIDRLGKAATAVGAQNPGGVDVFLSYAGRVIELQQERLMVRERSRIPGAYWARRYPGAGCSGLPRRCRGNWPQPSHAGRGHCVLCRHHGDCGSGPARPRLYQCQPATDD